MRNYMPPQLAMQLAINAGVRLSATVRTTLLMRWEPAIHLQRWRLCMSECNSSVLAHISQLERVPMESAQTLHLYYSFYPESV